MLLTDLYHLPASESDMCGTTLLKKVYRLDLIIILSFVLMADNYTCLAR